MADLNIPNLNIKSDKYIFKKKLNLRRKSKKRLFTESFILFIFSVSLVYINYLIPNKKLLGLLPMPFNTTKIKNLYCVGDSCFPGQGLNAVAFSGYACAHKIGSKLNINSFNLPD